MESRKGSPAAVLPPFCLLVGSEIPSVSRLVRHVSIIAARYAEVRLRAPSVRQPYPRTFFAAFFAAFFVAAPRDLGEGSEFANSSLITSSTSPIRTSD